MRVATIPLQRTTTDAMQRAQERLAVTQRQLATGRKAPDLAALGPQATRTLSAHTLLAKQQAQGGVASRLGTTLSLYDTHISAVETVGMDISQQIMSTIAAGDGAGFDEAVQGGFEQFRAALNGTEGGVPLFGGGRSETPFAALSMSELAGTAPADAFRDGEKRAAARVGDNLDMTYGVTARDIGLAMTGVFKALAEAGPFDGTLNAAQIDALKAVKGQIDDALGGVRSVNAANGRRQSHAETLVTRSEDRAILLKDVIGQNEDADLAQVASDLAQQKTLLEASYSVFGQLSDLSLLQYLR